jgi:hypothetical protein
MDTHSVIAVSPATDVVKDNRDRALFAKTVADVATPSSRIVSAPKKKVSSDENPTITSLFIGT